MTQAQQDAKIRNWKILRLRGLAANIRTLEFEGEERDMMLAYIDNHLERLRAATESEHKSSLGNP